MESTEWLCTPFFDFATNFPQISGNNFPCLSSERIIIFAVLTLKEGGTMKKKTPAWVVALFSLVLVFCIGIVASDSATPAYVIKPPGINWAIPIAVEQPTITFAAIPATLPDILPGGTISATYAEYMITGISSADIPDVVRRAGVLNLNSVWHMITANAPRLQPTCTARNGTI